MSLPLVIVREGCSFWIPVVSRFVARLDLEFGDLTPFQNYLDPFNPSTAIRFDLPEASEVRLVVFSLLGREVATVLDKPIGAGQHAVTWNAGAIPSGVYLYRLEAGDFVETRQLVLLK